MKKRVWLILAVLVVAVSAVAAVVLLRDDGADDLGFEDNGKGEPYSQGIPLNEMDFNIYWREYLSGTIYTLLDYGWEIHISLPCDVHYYAEKDGECVLTLPEGTEVTVFPGGSPTVRTYGYGLICWPDYEKGWRYGQPFVTGDEEVRFMAGPAYYVKTSELEAVAEAFYAVNEEILQKQGASRHADRYAKRITRYLDNELFDYGIFYSPEL